ncbi:MAG: HD domain-containing protein [Pseudomonadales bacterium]|nr:HD domain-containing protein [Candidatus Woesebacteria bacterium]MCB9801644.1 HD domain-containing protein [Pseudomonadales bacterium]
MHYEKFLRATIFPELELGRPGWDKLHTPRVVAYAKKILDHTPNLPVNRDVLVIATYAHDWGYAGLFQNGSPLQIDDVISAKEFHMKIGAEKIQALLQNDVFDFLSQEQKRRIVHLVGVHDKLQVLTKPDEIILMEADTLGGLDPGKTKPSFDAASNARYMQRARDRRLPLFITEYGRAQFELLYAKREALYADN